MNPRNRSFPAVCGASVVPIALLLTIAAAPRDVAIIHGVAGYDLRSDNDQVLPFDFNGDQNADLFLYRPGRGAAWVARSDEDGTFTAVYQQGDPGAGIAGYDLRSADDRILPFDYNGDGKDDLFLYRPGRGAAWVARSNGDGTFTAVYHEGDPGAGIAGYNLRSAADRVFRFDYNGDRKDDLFLYRPGRGAAWVARSAADGTFTAVYQQGDPGAGIAGYDLRSADDRILPFDYNGDGKDDLFLYRPGRGAAWVARSNGDGTFTAVYHEGDPGVGIAGYDLRSREVLRLLNALRLINFEGQDGQRGPRWSPCRDAACH